MQWSNETCRESIEISAVLHVRMTVKSSEERHPFGWPKAFHRSTRLDLGYR